MDHITGYINRYKRILRIDESYQTKLVIWTILSDDLQKFLSEVAVNLRLSLEARCACQMYMHVNYQVDISCQLLHLPLAFSGDQPLP